MLPWRRSATPYRIWVSEVLLQQTRVEQVGPYFERFIARFPDVETLARARLSEVLKVWEGAGYYGRARHLHAAARRLADRSGGRLPTTVDELEELPGVGPYIARAIASLAFGVPVLALEANGLRIGARLTGDWGDIRGRPARARLEKFLTLALPKGRSAAFNEALMELGESICRPRRPRCGECPLSRRCRARQELPDPGVLPIRTRRPRPPTVRAVVVIVERAGRWLVQPRPETGLLGGLWEFPGGKVGARETVLDAAERELFEETGLRPTGLRPLGMVHHAYSHFSVDLHVVGAKALGTVRPGSPARWLTPSQFARHPRPMATVKIVRLVHGVRSPARSLFSRGSGSRPGRTSA